jgi:hypothetical protein
MTLEPDATRLRPAGTPPLGERASATLDLRFLDLDLRIGAPCSEDLLWLQEFLGPAFSAATNPRIAVDVVLRIDRDRVDGWRAAGPADEDLIAFRLDQRVVRLPRWRSGEGELLAWDERSRAFYRVRPAARRIEVWCREAGRKARRALMRAVRELALEHAARSQGLLLHASCLDHAQGAIAFSGPKGCGKTTLLIAALAGTTSSFLANDRVFVDLSRDPPRAVPLPSIVSVRASTVRHFPALARGLDAKRWSPWVRWEDLPDLQDHSSSAVLPGESHHGLSPFQFRRWIGCPWTAEAPMRLLVLPKVESGCAEVRIRRLASDEIHERLPSILFAAGTSERSELFALEPSEPAPATAASCTLLAARVPIVELTLPLNRVEPSAWFDELTRHVAGTAR